MSAASSASISSPPALTPPLTRLALIGGSSFLDSSLLSAFVSKIVSTPFGAVRLHANHEDLNQANVVFVQRHEASEEKEKYSPPHLINYKAICTALKQIGVSHVIAFGSTGSLKKTLQVGQLIMPDDWINFAPISTFDYAKGGHVGTGLDDALRRALLSTLRGAGFSVLDNGVYAQTQGPRFETPAEIRSLAIQGGDIVGMTCGHEATLCRELGLPYALVCIIDNMANGVAGVEISYEEFRAGVAKNLVTMEKVLNVVFQHFSPPPPTIQQPSGATSSKISVDSMVHARWVVPIIPAGVLEYHTLVVRDGLIVDLLPTKEAQAKYVAMEEESFMDSTLMPGFINAHTHLGMSLMRGYADDHCLSEWLTKHIWPGEKVFVSPEFVRDSCELGLAEMIRGGTTCCNDMYWFPEVCAEIVARIGFRAVVGLIVIDFPTSYANDAQEYIEKGLKLYEAMKSHPRLSFSMAPHAPYTVCDEHLKKLKDLADKVVLRNPAPTPASTTKLGSFTTPARFHIHLHETASETIESAALTPGMSCHRSVHKCRPFANFDHNLHLTGEQLIAVHMTQMTEEEIQRVAETKTQIVHCPTSNLKLASGMCPIAALHRANANVALGTDSTASNNALDMLSEIKLAAVLAKCVANDPSALPAYEALKMATFNGAVALGLDQQTGSLEVGKSADFIRVKMDTLESLPLFDVLSHLCYVSSREHVQDVWVAGRRLMRDRRLLTLDECSIKSRARVWADKMTKEKARQAEERRMQEQAAQVVPANGSTTTATTASKKRAVDETAEQSTAVKPKV